MKTSRKPPTGRRLVSARSLRQQPEVMTADEVAAMLRVNRKTVYESVERGELPCVRLGRRMLFSRAALLRWLGQGVQSEGAIQ